MQTSKQGPIKFLRISEILYLSLTILSFYLLVVSRTGEARTIWEVLHPAFLPTLFVTTSLLLSILLTSEKVSCKLVLVIIHSILIHSLFSIIFPAGDISGQQMILGKTRRVFDNTVLHGLSGWPTQTVPIFIYQMFRGVNLQAGLSTIFARILSVDIFYVHLFFVPVLWGVFVPTASFLTTKALGVAEKAAVLSSLLISAFPYATYFGAISVPNSLGFIFFFYSLYFMLKHLSSNDSKTKYWMAAFSFFSFLSHYLTGIMSFALLLLAISFKAYENEKNQLSITTRISLLASLFISVSLLPLSFIYLGLFNSTTSVFSLARFYELPAREIVGLFLIGELTYGFDLETIFLVIIGPTLGLLWMTYLLYKSKRNPTAKLRLPIIFLFVAFAVVLVDYRILKLFMEGLPINEERLWVLRDFIAAPFVALTIYAVVSSLKTFLKATSPPTISVTAFKKLSRGNIMRILSLLTALIVLIPVVLGGWITLSLNAVYPQVAPLQITWYELEAVKYIEEKTTEKYVVIGDIWTIFAGEMIVGVWNPEAYYFGERDPRGSNLFTEMRRNPSPKVMTDAMNQTGTDTTIAYFVITEPRLGSKEFNDIVTYIRQVEQLDMFHMSDNGKLYVFSYRKR